MIFGLFGNCAKICENKRVTARVVIIRQSERAHKKSLDCSILHSERSVPLNISKQIKRQRKTAQSRRDSSIIAPADKIIHGDAEKYAQLNEDVIVGLISADFPTRNGALGNFEPLSEILLEHIFFLPQGFEPFRKTSVQHSYLRDIVVYRACDIRLRRYNYNIMSCEYCQCKSRNLLKKIAFETRYKDILA